MSESEKIVRDAFEKAGKAFDEQKDLEGGTDDFYIFVTTKYVNKNLVKSDVQSSAAYVKQWADDMEWDKLKFSWNFDEQQADPYHQNFNRKELREHINKLTAALL